MKRVLLVDDERPLVQLAGGFLLRNGWAVTPAYDGAAALKLFRATPGCFDVVFSDIAMPGMQGLELMRYVHTERPGFPVVLASGYPVDRSLPHFSATAAVLKKPYQMEDMLLVLQEAIDSQQT